MQGLALPLSLWVQLSISKAAVEEKCILQRCQVLKTWWHHSEQGEAKLVSKISSGVR